MKKSAKKKSTSSKITLLAVLLGILIALVVFFNQYQNTFDPRSGRTSATSSSRIFFPQANDNLTRGQSYDLLWTPGQGTTEIFLIDKALEKDGVSISLADRVYNIKNSGSYEYTIPLNIPTGLYKITIGEISSGYFNIK